jgi:hypothetical protein
MKDSAGSYASPDFTNTVAELNTFGAVIVNSFYYMTVAITPTDAAAPCPPARP